MWPKVIDEMIAGLPTNWAQRLELEKFRLKSSNDEARIKELEAQVANLKPAHGFKIDTIKVLKVFFEAGRELTARQIESHLQMQPSIVDYHFDILFEAVFIRQTRAAVILRMRSMIELYRALGFDRLPNKPEDIPEYKWRTEQEQKRFNSRAWLYVAYERAAFVFPFIIFALFALLVWL